MAMSVDPAAVLNLCRDEICNSLKRKIELVFGEPFNLIGLAGVLTCGVTGMGAGLSHAPRVSRALLPCTVSLSASSQAPHAAAVTSIPVTPASKPECGKEAPDLEPTTCPHLWPCFFPQLQHSSRERYIFFRCSGPSSLPPRGIWPITKASLSECLFPESEGRDIELTAAASSPSFCSSPASSSSSSSRSFSSSYSTFFPSPPLPPPPPPPPPIPSFPHVAVNAAGELGKISRAARPDSAACGALLKVLEDFKGNGRCRAKSGVCSTYPSLHVAARLPSAPRLNCMCPMLVGGCAGSRGGC